MPVMIIGTEDALGRASAHAMLRTGGEVRVWLDAERNDDNDARAWRATGFKAAIGTSDDEGRLEAALEQVHTIVHLAGGPLEDPQAGTDALATLASAALGAGCRRLIWVTDLALDAFADLHDPPDYVAALAQRQALVYELPMDVVIIRTGLRYGPGDALTQMLATHAQDLRLGVVHAPVWIDDVAAAVVTADAQRGADVDVHLEIDLVGPDRLPLAHICETLAQAVPRPDPDVQTGGWVPADLSAWLRIPAVGGPDAVGKQGFGFADGVARLRQSQEQQSPQGEVRHG